MADDDWLDNDTPPAVVETPVKPKRKRRPKALIKAERNLTLPQRTYLQLLISSNTLKDAAKAMDKAGMPADRSTLYRWRQNPQFAKALELTTNHLYETAGIDKARIMLDAEKAKQLALAPQPILYKGEKTGEFEVDLAAYLRALELQSKGVGIVDQNQKGVEVNIDIDFSGRADEPPQIHINGSQEG